MKHLTKVNRFEVINHTPNGEGREYTKWDETNFRARDLAAKWKPDERGVWSAYKCPYGRTHWHVGHAPTSPGGGE